VRKGINVNSGIGALGPGNMANAALGRAMGLIVKNIGGARQGIEDMGILGNPGKYTMVIGESEEESPWEPLHVEHGFSREDSTISLFFPNCYSQIWPYGTDDKGILNGIIYNIIPFRTGLFCLVIPPAYAKILADKGWTKKEVKAFISEYARVPAYRHRVYWGAFSGTPAKEQVPMNPMDSMRILRDPSWIRLLVAGGPGSWMGLHTGAYFDGMDWVTKKVELPANWEKLAQKYRHVAPTYVRY
jgi:hypothetical protein